jgi:tetratricopeptide (TPR) repeat protein
MFALNEASYSHIYCGKYAAANALVDELIALANEKGALFWKMCGMMAQGYVMVLTGETSNAVQMIACGLTAYRSTGATLFMPLHLTNSARARSGLGKIALLSPEQDPAKAEAYFERALAVARQQQAKSFELRAAMSLARLWRDQGKAQQARELLAPIYGWFTEGFDTRDLKEAKACWSN